METKSDESNKSEINYRCMVNEDLSQFVDVHLRSFNGLFLSELGADFLIILYSFILEDPSGIAFVAEQSKRVIGCFAGTSEPHGFYSRALKRKWLAFGFASLPAIFRKPRIVGRVLRAIRKPREVGHERGECELMSIAVSPEFSGRGVGQVLVREFCRKAMKNGCSSVYLTTDQKDNDGANHFYPKCGFVLTSDYSTPEGRCMNEYTFATRGSPEIE